MSFLVTTKRPSSLVQTWPRDELFSSLQTDINRLFGDFFHQNQRKDWKTWIPPVDIKETENEYCLTVDLPGFDKKNVHVSLEDDVLTIKGERKVEEKKENEKTHHTERFYGSFQRDFILPEKDVYKEKIAAKFENGVLSLTMPKKLAEQKQVARIEIH